jgi:hypothetical protein
MASRRVGIAPRGSVVFTHNKALRRQLLQQRLRLLQIARIEPLGEPPVNRSQQFTRFLHFAVVAPELRGFFSKN